MSLFIQLNPYQEIDIFLKYFTYVSFVAHAHFICLCLLVLLHLLWNHMSNIQIIGFVDLIQIFLRVR